MRATVTIQQIEAWPVVDGWHVSPAGQHVRLGNRVKLRDRVTLGDGAILGDGVILGDRVTLGDEVTLGQYVRLGDEVKLGAHVKLGDRVTLGDGVILGDGGTLNDGVTLGDRVTLGEYVTLGAYVTLGQSVRLGDEVTSEALNAAARAAYAALGDEHHFTKWVTRNRQSPNFDGGTTVTYPVGAVLTVDNAEVSDRQCGPGLHVLRYGHRPEWYGLCQAGHDLIALDVLVRSQDILFAGLPTMDGKLRVRALTVLT